MSSRGGYERLPIHDNHPKPHVFCRPRSIFLFLKFAVPAAILLILFGLFVYEPHIELAFYERKWIKQEIEQLAPLAGCFDPDRRRGVWEADDLGASGYAAEDGNGLL
ncbi:hypothetical protein PTI98_008523 [Pleurotus ostreatus]|nr:hypothetical protein PTI98_008523 [Pleurotus ostreatus]